MLVGSTARNHIQGSNGSNITIVLLPKFKEVVMRMYREVRVWVHRRLEKLKAS